MEGGRIMRAKAGEGGGKGSKIIALSSFISSGRMREQERKVPSMFRKTFCGELWVL